MTLTPPTTDRTAECFVTVNRAQLHDAVHQAAAIATLWDVPVYITTDAPSGEIRVGTRELAGSAQVAARFSVNAGDKYGAVVTREYAAADLVEAVDAVTDASAAPTVQLMFYRLDQLAGVIDSDGRALLLVA